MSMAVWAPGERLVLAARRTVSSDFNARILAFCTSRHWWSVHTSGTTRDVAVITRHPWPCCNPYPVTAAN